MRRGGRATGRLFRARSRLRSRENRRTLRDCTPAADANTAVNHLAPLLRDKLDASDRDDLERMLEAVAVIHGGPIEA
ncbi:hypothetical protein DHODJN_05485 [Methylorubrum extorquens]|jgi:hypothetical protein